MSIEAAEKEIIESFNILGEDWEARYEFLIDLGKSLPLLPDSEKNDDQLIKGCQSRLWLKSTYDGQTVKFRADSDAIISKGIAAIVIKVLDNNTPDDIINAPLNFIHLTGLKEHLSPTRANGLVSLIKQIKLDALAFKSQKQVL